MKISVIVPVYNAEKYLKKCISSVQEQTYKNWELILVDDGSTDKSLEIIKMFSGKDNKIKVIYQNNSGPGVARNNGLKIATGDYVVFLDADDFIDGQYFELLVAKAEKNDVVFIDINQIDTNGKLLKKEAMSEFEEWGKDRILRSQMTGKIPWGGVRKAVKLQLIRENNILYTSHNVGEEALYSFQILYYAKSIGFLDEKPVYFYVNHEDSQSKTVMMDPWGPIVNVLKNYLVEKQIYSYYANSLNAFNLSATVVSLDRIEQLYSGEEKKKKIQMRMEQYRKIYDESAELDTKNMSTKAKIFIPFIRRGISRPILLCSRLRKCIK